MDHPKSSNSATPGAEELEVIDLTPLVPMNVAPQKPQAIAPPQKKPRPQLAVRADPIHVPPHNIEAEQGILGCGLICTDGSVMEKCSAAGMTPEYFFKTSHQSLFAAMLALHRRGDLHDDIILLDELRAQKTEEESGGIAAIYSLQNKVETTLSSNYYIKAVRKKYVARATIRVNRETNERLQNGEDPTEVLADQQERLNSIEPLEDLSKPLFVDLREILAGKFKPELPSIGSLVDGLYLFYRSRINEVHGAPGDGKSNVGIAISAQVLNDGGTVIFIDPEDTAAAVVRRLISFGASPEAIEKRFKYVEDPTPQEILEAIKWAEQNKAHLIWMDGLAEFLSAQSLSENEPADILQFFRRYVQPFANTGAAVVVSDHVVKSTESRGNWSRGSGAKMGRYDGVSYEVRLGEAYSPCQAGYVKLVVSKDRNGGVGPKGTIAAEVHFRPLGQDVTEVSFQKPQPKSKFRPTAVMNNIITALTDNPEMGKRDLRKIGSSRYVDQAIELLIEEGRLECHREGPGKSSKFTILKPISTDA